MSCTDAPVRPLTDFPELLRLAADLLTDPPAKPRTLRSAADFGVVPGSNAEDLLAKLVFHAPDGPDSSNDALTRAGLAFGLNRLADAPSHPHDVYLQRFYELRAAGLKIQELELAARKRQATIDRQGLELGDLRKLAERDEDGYLLCTHCRRERSAGRKAVQGSGDCRWLNDGPVECAVCSADHPTHAHAVHERELLTWLSEDGGPDDPARIVLDGGRLIAWGEALPLFQGHASHMAARAVAEIERRLRLLANGESLAVSYEGLRLDGVGRACIEQPEYLVLGPDERPPLGKSWTVYGPMTAMLRAQGKALDDQKAGLAGQPIVAHGAAPAYASDLAPEQGQCPKCRQHNGPDADDCMSFYCERCKYSYGASET